MTRIKCSDAKSKNLQLIFECYWLRRNHILEDICQQLFPYNKLAAKKAQSLLPRRPEKTGHRIDFWMARIGCNVIKKINTVGPRPTARAHPAFSPLQSLPENSGARLLF